MAEEKIKAQTPEEIMDHLQPRLKEGALIALVALCIYLCLALFSFDPADAGWSYTGAGSEVSNLVGKTGAWISECSVFSVWLHGIHLSHDAWLSGMACVQSARP